MPHTPGRVYGAGDNPNVVPEPGGRHIREVEGYELRPPASPEEREAYHDLRRRLLFEARGRFGVYEPDHPDERRPGNHPLLLLSNGDIVGVVRVDLACPVAILRRVAVDDRAQGRGHGHALITLVAGFARRHGCTELRTFAAPDAVGFYQRCGFETVASAETPNGTVLMRREVS